MDLQVTDRRDFTLILMRVRPKPALARPLSNRTGALRKLQPGSRLTMTLPML